jgi:hypothetical protein
MTPARALVVLVALAAASPAAADPFADRFTVMAAAALDFGTIDGRSGSGFAIQPTLERTFDRVEVRVDYLLADWNDVRDARAGAFVQRATASAGYQLRKRIESMTMDAVFDGGFAVERIDRDAAGSIVRPAVSTGVVVRMLPNMNDREHRVWFGFEMMAHAIIAPAPHGTDAAFVFAFGVPVGR